MLYAIRLYGITGIGVYRRLRVRSSFQSADTIIQREYVNTRESHPNETEQTPFLFVIIEMGQDNESMRRYRARIRPVGAAPVRRPLRVRSMMRMENKINARALVVVSSMTARAPPTEL